MTATIYSDVGFTVTAKMLTTPRRTFDLARVEYVSIRQPLFLLTLVFAGIGLNGFALAFWSYLYPVEKLGIFGASLLVLILSWMVGTLRVHSLALRDGEHGVIIGPIGRLRRVKDAVDQAIAARAER